VSEETSQVANDEEGLDEQSTENKKSTPPDQDEHLSHWTD
jgi:hypothetical protein